MKAYVNVLSGISDLSNAASGVPFKELTTKGLDKIV